MLFCFFHFVLPFFWDIEPRPQNLELSRVYAPDSKSRIEKKIKVLKVFFKISDVLTFENRNDVCEVFFKNLDGTENIEPIITKLRSSK